MDNLDIHLLQLLQQNNRLSTEELGHKVGLSATACQRRLKKLRSSSYIKKEVAVLDTRQLKPFVTVLVELTLKQGGAAQIDKIKTSMLAEPMVQQCYYTAGNADFILVVVTPGMSEYEALTRRLFFTNENIEKFTSNVVMENVKTGLEIPLTT